MASPRWRVAAAWIAGTLLAGLLAAQLAAAESAAQPRQPRPRGSQQQQEQPWHDTSRPLAARVAALVAALTTDEKISLMKNHQAPVDRLGLRAFQFWTECLHGHLERTSGKLPTLFPQPLVLASAWDDALAYQVFTAISDELRAKSNYDHDRWGDWKYLTCWTPHVNLFKEPRWGRGSETFGEDPHLTSWIGMRVVQGLQGSHATYKKVVATCKHFLGYGLEGAEGVSRYSHNVDISPQDMTDTELPPFRACLQSAGAQGVMCAYNAVNGTPSCSSGPLLNGILRGQLGFGGYVVSDCNALIAMDWGHGSAPSLAKASADAINAGVDMFCDRIDEIQSALSAGLINTSSLDTAVSRSLAIRFQTGQFDPPSANPWRALQLSSVNSAAHKALARSVAQKGAVLLRNVAPPGASSPLLPLNKAALRKLCVVGPLADSQEHMMGNYYGRWDSSAAATPLQGIREELAGTGIQVTYARGMDVAGQMHFDWPLEDALTACKGAGAAVVVVGSSMIENGLDKDATSYQPAHEGEGLDRNDLALPGRQADVVKALASRAPGLPLVVLLMNGGGLDVAWMERLDSVGAMMAVGFPGQEGGRAIADLLFGRVSPSGRLPITWYRSNYTAAVSPLDLRMRPDAQSGYPGRSYRFVADPSYVLYPFGHGLSYTSFAYSNMRLLQPGDDGCVNAGAPPAYCLRVDVANTGTAASEHVVPLYMAHAVARGTRGYPLQSLRGFKRTRLLQPGASVTVEMLLTRGDFLMPRPEDGANTLLPGPWQFSVGVWDAPALTLPQAGGGASPSARSPGRSSGAGAGGGIFGDLFSAPPRPRGHEGGADSARGLSMTAVVTAA